MAGPRPMFSLIIVTYNSGKTIGRCLKSLSAQTFGDCEVIVVDNASTDGTAALVASLYARARLIGNAANVGFGAAVNQAAKAAVGEYLLLLNPDTAVQPTFLEKWAGFLRTNKLAAVAGCALVDDQGRRQESCWKPPSIPLLLAEVLLPYKLSLDIITDRPVVVGEVKMVSGACMSVKRDLFERLEGFDEKFFMYYEDADLCLRARKQGYRVYFNPGISVYHQISGSVADGRNLILQYTLSKMYFFRKHFSKFKGRCAVVLITAGSVIRIPVYWLFGKLLRREELLRLSEFHKFVLKSLAGPLTGDFREPGRG